MKFKKIVSGIASLTLAASAFAGLAVTANAGDTIVNHSFNFNTENPLTFNTNRVNVSHIAQDSETATASGTKGILSFGTVSNSSNAYSWARADLSAYIGKATSYTVSYKVFFHGTHDVRGVVGLVNPDDRNSVEKQTVSTTAMAGSVGRFAKENYLRFENGGTRDFLSSRDVNQWISVSITVDVSNKTYSYSATGDATASANGTFEGKGLTAAPKSLEVLVYSPANTADLIEIDDLTISATIPELEQVAYKLDAVNGDITLKEIKSGMTDINSDMTIGGIPAYIESNGSFYKLADDSVTGYKKSVNVGSGYAGTVSYEAAPSVVYFNDAESAPWKTEGDSYSGGVIGAWGNNGNVASIKLPAGYYTVNINVASKGGSGSNFRGEAIDVNGVRTAETSDNRTGDHEFPITITEANSTVTIYGKGTNKATDNLDFVLITKTGDYVAPTAAYKLDKEFASANDNASVWTLAVTPGTNALTSVDVTVNDHASSGAKTEMPELTNGTYNFFVIVNKLANDITSMSAVVNGAACTTTRITE